MHTSVQSPSHGSSTVTSALRPPASTPVTHNQTFIIIASSGDVSPPKSGDGRRYNMTDEQSEEWLKICAGNRKRCNPLSMSALIVAAQLSPTLSIRNLHASTLRRHWLAHAPLVQPPSIQRPPLRRGLTKDQCDLMDAIFAEHGTDQFPGYYRKLVADDAVANQILLAVPSATWSKQRDNYRRHLSTGLDNWKRRYAEPSEPLPIIIALRDQPNQPLSHEAASLFDDRPSAHSSAPLGPASTASEPGSTKDAWPAPGSNSVASYDVTAHIAPTDFADFQWPEAGASGPFHQTDFDDYL